MKALFVVGYWLFIFFNKQQRTNNKAADRMTLTSLEGEKFPAASV